MGTSSGFTPPATPVVPECPYAPRMTRAAALALRTAGGLLENCVVVITDGPTIGTAGNTSVTEIELQPVTPTDLGEAAIVHTAFSTSGWVGIYDIDTNSITQLTDDFGNTMKDIDALAATVETQWPWHLGGPLFRDNYGEDTTFTGVDTAVGFLINNRFVGSVVNMTGKTGGSVTDNVITNASIIGGAGGASFAMTRSQISAISTATPVINHTGTGQFSYADVIQKDGFIVAHSGITTLTVSDTTLRNHGSAVADLSHNVLAGTSQTNINDCELISPGGAPVVWANNGDTGTMSAFRSTLNGTIVSKAAGSTGPLTITGCDLGGATITVGPANGATTNNFQAVTGVGVFNLLGPVAGGGRNDFTNAQTVGTTAVTVAANATAGAGLTGGYFSGFTFNQNRTAGTGSTTLFDAFIRGFSTLSDNGTVDPGSAGGTANSPLSINRLTMVDSTVTLGNVTGQTGSGTILQQADLIGSTLTMVGPNGPASATSFLDKLRLHGQSLNNAGFGCQNVIIEGTGISKTFTAYNLNRMANKSYDDIL